MQENRPLRILIVGAGIGGLAAAVALRRQGHDVEVFEQSRLAQETGAAIHLAPNANGLLRRFGLRAEDIGGVECKGITEFLPDGALKYSVDLSKVNQMWQHPWHLVHRAHLHSALKDIATEEDGAGKPAKLQTSSRVEQVDPDNAIVSLADGTCIEGDLIVGADGIRSATRMVIADLTPFDSGKSAFRFMLPTNVLASDPLTRSFVEKDDHLTMWIGDDRRLVMYPCQSKTVMNFVAIHPSCETDDKAKGTGWQGTGSRTQLMKVFASFGPGVATILEKVDETKLRVWTLFDMAKMSSFVHGKLAIMGDAAHPFLPHQGQGGGQAIEDAASLAALLPLGTTTEAIPDRLRLYEECRYERSHAIQEFTRLAGRDASELDATGESLDMQKYSAYNFGHDEWHASTQALQKHLRLQNKDVRYRQPYGFGPTPGPRQPRNLRKADSALLAQKQQESFKTFSTRFKSSRTYLQGLLPPGFVFSSPATIVSVTASCTILDGLAWLGGGGYSFFALRIHGVQYTRADGTLVHGAYIPVLFENLADAVVTGREELGLPKVFADIVVREAPLCSEILLSWRGYHFASMKLGQTGIGSSGQDQEQSEPNSLVNSTGSGDTAENQLAYRYVPAVGRPGETDAEYAVTAPLEPVGEVVSRTVASSATLSFQSRDFASLPTLHHITRVLAEMPIYGIVKADITEGKGLSDLSAMSKI